MPPSPHDPENVPDNTPFPSQSTGRVHEDQTEIVGSGSGSVLADPVTDESGTYVVLADPEGHEFCIVDA